MLARAVLIGALMAIAAAPVADAAQRRELGRLPSVPQSDGTRYVVWADQHYVRVVDTETGGRSLVPLPPECYYAAIGINTLVFMCAVEREEPGCSGDEVAPVFYSLRTGTTQRPADVDAFLAQQDVRGRSGDCSAVLAVSVGARWMSYAVGVWPDFETWYLDRVAGGEPVSTEVAEKTVIDLGRRSRLSTICSPLRRSRDPDYDPDDYDHRRFSSPYLPFQWLGRYALKIGYPHRALYLHRCGSKKRRRLAGGVASWGLSPRAAYWTDADRLHLFLLRSGRTLSYRLKLKYEWHQLATTTSRVYVTESSGWDPGERTTYVFRIPER